jgi:hypothetical protein
MDGNCVPVTGLDCYFYPWKGPNYEKNSIFGIRILVLGESTYLSESERDQYQADRKKWGACYFVHHDVLAYRNGNWTHQFWTKWINGLHGSATLQLQQRQGVLDSVAFWNYADGPPLSGNRQYPPDKILEQANGKLRRVIATLQPDLVILMSRRLWGNLSEGESKFSTDPNAAHGATPEGQVDNHKFHFLTVRHPSGGFGAKDSGAIRHAIQEFGGHQPGAPAEAGDSPNGEHSQSGGREDWHRRLDAVLEARDANALAAMDHLIEVLRIVIEAEDALTVPRAILFAVYDAIFLWLFGEATRTSKQPNGPERKTPCRYLPAINPGTDCRSPRCSNRRLPRPSTLAATPLSKRRPDKLSTNTVRHGVRGGRPNNSSRTTRLRRACLAQEDKFGGRFSRDGESWRTWCARLNWSPARGREIKPRRIVC